MTLPDDDDPLLIPNIESSNNLSKPGLVIIYDYCEERRNENNNNALDNLPNSPFKVKAVQWNIERAYKLDSILELLTKEGTTGHDQRNLVKPTLKKQPRIIRSKSTNEEVEYKYKDFDVMAIQEFDIGCARSKYRNSALEMARALKMRCIYVSEFEEIYSREKRNGRSQGGGVHGNGILTWWDIEKVEVIEHVAIFDWERDGDKLGEPRHGGRYTVAAFLKHPQHPERKMIVYSVHLEVFCGIFGRMRQFSQIFEHSRKNIGEYPLQMILGDLNTMAHGLARFFPKFCSDAMRWRSVGWSEAEWWQRNLFNVTPRLASARMNHPDSNTNTINDIKTLMNSFLAAHYHPKVPYEKVILSPLIGPIELEQEIEHEFNSDSEDYDSDHDSVESDKVTNSTNTKNNNTSTRVTKRSTGSTSKRIFTDTELSNLINPYFFCPFSPRQDKTLQIRGYSGKLDWMLMRGWRVLKRGTDNDLYTRSDHKLLWIEVESFSKDMVDQTCSNNNESNNDQSHSVGADDLAELAHDHYFKSISSLKKRKLLHVTMPSASCFNCNSNILISMIVGVGLGIFFYSVMFRD